MLLPIMITQITILNVTDFESLRFLSLDRKKNGISWKIFSNVLYSFRLCLDIYKVLLEGDILYSEYVLQQHHTIEWGGGGRNIPSNVTEVQYRNQAASDNT